MDGKPRRPPEDLARIAAGALGGPVEALVQDQEEEARVVRDLRGATISIMITNITIIISRII